MAITYPRTDIMTTVDWSPNTLPLQLATRQEQSRLANGKTIGKDLGPALWTGTFETVPLPVPTAISFEAMMNSLDGVIQTFEAGDMRAATQYPAAYPTGAFADTGVLASVPTNKSMTVSGLPAGFQLSVGTFLQFDYGTSRALHQVMEAVTANGSGLTPAFEVRPYIRAGYTISAAVKFKNPRGIFVLLPGTLMSKMNDNWSTIVTFQAIQNLS